MEKKSCHPKLFEIKCQNIIPLLLYIAFCWYKHQTIPSTSTLHSPNLKTFFLIEVNMRLSFIFGAQIFFLFFLLSSSILFARELTNEQGPNTKIEVSGDSFVLDLEGDESLKMLGMEKCNIEDEDCMQRRMTLEAHLDYIYTQHHKP
ncbi:putative phytosulfokine [Medicago truncatula]|uniref:Phytosulfokine n=2 Tax=Medicago truncatula TaxID=3880 RepID=A0A396JDL9_MEDTR|nr:putative phytosulfokine [Medicago truncatula]